MYIKVYLSTQKIDFQVAEHSGNLASMIYIVREHQMHVKIADIHNDTSD